MTLPHYTLAASPDRSAFTRQTETQQMYAQAGYIELPEVVKVGKKRQPQRENLMRIEAPRGIQEGDPRLERAATMRQLLNSLGMLTGDTYITTYDYAGVKIYVDNMWEEDESNVLDLVPANVKSIEFFTPNNAINCIFGVRPSPNGKIPGVLFIFMKDGSEILKSKKKNSLSFVRVNQLGYRHPVEFYSPQYTNKDNSTRPDHRTTLYWNPKVKTDANGHATVTFYASDVSKRYLVTLEGISDDGMIVREQVVIK